MRPPSEFGITVGVSPSRTATTELVVPRSIPTTLLIGHASLDQSSSSEYRYRLSLCQAPNMSLVRSIMVWLRSDRLNGAEQRACDPGRGPARIGGEEDGL